MDNVVQLVLCLVILVGQRVLGMAADRRAVQTYENAEAIFERVTDLQAHLDRHDRALGRGVSLLESSPHPWIQRHRVQPAPQAVDQTTGVNGRIAAWLTQRLGSMWAFYVAAVTQLVWIGMAELGVQKFDPYPFAFMSFLSTLAQLVFMIVIMVGQDVLNKAADRRSEQTLLDAEAILHECRRMKARLVAQDRVIDSLADYTSTQVTRQLARAVHQSRLEAAVAEGQQQGSRPALRPWDELPEELKEANRLQARKLGELLAEIGCLMVPTYDPSLIVDFDQEEARLLARREYELRLSERKARGVTKLPSQRDTLGDGLVPWELLSDRARERAVDMVRRLPAMLADVGFQVLRTGAGADGAGELDFTPEDWGTLGTSLMAAGVLVALAEGVADPEELSALVKLLREASVSHPRRFIRELAGSSTSRPACGRTLPMSGTGGRVENDPRGHRRRRPDRAGGTHRLPRVPDGDRHDRRRRQQRRRLLRPGRQAPGAQRGRSHGGRPNRDATRPATQRVRTPEPSSRTTPMATKAAGTIQCPHRSTIFTMLLREPSREPSRHHTTTPAANTAIVTRAAPVPMVRKTGG